MLSFSCYFLSVCLVLSYSVRQFSSVRLVSIVRDICVGSIDGSLWSNDRLDGRRKLVKDRKGARVD